jgi:glycerophosphoryl diester phosphodiesterase
MTAPVRFSVLGFLIMMSPVSALPEIIAHRGASHDAPENTLAAHRLAWEQEADGIEGDYRLTLDGRIIACHDPTTKRTSNRDLEVWFSTFAELRELDAGSWKGETWKGEKMPSLEEVLAVVKPGKKTYVEIYNPETVPALLRAFEGSGLKAEQVVVISFDRASVAATKKLIPALKSYWIVDLKPDKATGQLTPGATEIIKTLKQTGADGVDCSREPGLDDNFVQAIQQAGFSFHVWTVNDPAEARRLAELGVNSITTDRPALIREGLKKQ